ncbi:tetratricopeptide repeat protein [Dokdonella ginsengisoli]|uniref:protein O-GlcNAc transferase n=1 Tax=Dokdonella ginsengisoli TaxID=363846 RepID=A0ABV9QUM3_9GAMM
MASTPSPAQTRQSRLAAEQLQIGVAHHRAGRLGLAASHYQRAAKLAPAHPEVWHLLGICALQGGNAALAVKHLRACIERRPDFAEARNHLGVALRRCGRHAESVAAFRGALDAKERYVEAAYNLGLACEAVGDAVAAEQAYRQALQWRPDDFNSAANLGNLLRGAGRLDEALPLLERAQRLQPGLAQANGNLALLLADLGRHDEAVRHAQAATVQEPAQPQWWRALGVAERLRKNLEPAIAALSHALALAPDDAATRAELAVAAAEGGQIEAARSAFAQVLRRAPDMERIRWLAALSLPSVYADEAEVDAERERFARGLDEIDAGLRLDTPQRRFAAYDAARGAGTFLLHYQARDNTALQNRFGDLLARVMTAFAPQSMQPCAWRALAHGGRLRVGVVSSHLMRHSVSRYFARMLAGLDPQRFEVRVWHGGRRDAVADRLAARVTAFEPVGDEAMAVAERIREARLDVLIYPETGMDPVHHVLASLRLAPVQCVLYGHPATSGLLNADFFLSGAALEPDDAASHYREQLVRLPGLGACPEPVALAAGDARAPAPADGAPLLLCPQNPLKLMPSFDAVLADVAARTQARIGFFARDGLIAQRFRARIERRFADAGLDARRSLAFLPVQAYEDYLAAVRAAPLLLDSTGFSGGATSLDAFAVGTPVLTLRGAMARGRQTAAMLDVMEIGELVATDAQDYAAKAAALLRDASLRQDVRERIAGRSARLFEARGVEQAFADFLSAAASAAA